MDCVKLIEGVIEAERQREIVSDRVGEIVEVRHRVGV